MSCVVWLVIVIFIDYPNFPSSITRSLETLNRRGRGWISRVSHTEIAHDLPPSRHEDHYPIRPRGIVYGRRDREAARDPVWT